MARDADGVRRSEKWQNNDTATDGQASDINSLYTAGNGWDGAYGEGGTDDPTRGEFNQLFKEITAITNDVNRMGAVLHWNDSVAYVTDAIVRHSANAYYRALRDNTNKNPSTETLDWERIFLNTHRIETAATAPTTTAGYQRIVFVPS